MLVAYARFVRRSRRAHPVRVLPAGVL